MRHKTLRQSGKTLKEAKSKLDTKVNWYCSKGWKCNGRISINIDTDYTKGKTVVTVSQEIVKET